MKLRMLIDGRAVAVELLKRGERTELRVDGERIEADVRWVDQRTLSLLLGGRSFELLIEPNGASSLVVSGPGLRHGLEYGGAARRGGTAAGSSGGFKVASPMPGKIVDVLVKPGDSVEPGQGLVIVEAMKMENELSAQSAGVVSAVSVSRGQVVEAGAVLVEVGPCSS